MPAQNQRSFFFTAIASGATTGASDEAAVAAFFLSPARRQTATRESPESGPKNKRPWGAPSSCVSELMELRSCPKGGGAENNKREGTT